MVPPNTHDWRLFIKPHELAFLLQVPVARRRLTLLLSYHHD